MIETFLRGGPIMWPILLLSIVTFGTVIERIIFLIREQTRCDSKCVMNIFRLVEHEKFDEAYKIGARCTDKTAQLLAAGLEHRDISFTDAMMEEANSQLDRFNRGLVILDTAVTLGPLLGLLGTVIGMMSAFGFVGGEGLAGKTEAITGGVAESLITVSFGLGVAIIAILPLNYLNSRLEKVRRELESAMTRMELLLKGSDQITGCAIRSQVVPEELRKSS
ncbi:MAG: MotA/TolQ/ExbB proton channel family protein [Verrucomicrobiota bacterium]